MKTIKIVFSVAGFAILFVTTALLEGCSGRKTTQDHLEDTQALQKIFPILEVDQVTVFRYQNWCKVICYSRGSFANTTNTSCTYIADRTPNLFDAKAETDLGRIWKEVRSTRSGVYEISYVRYNQSGKLIHGEFDCTSGFTRNRYVFDPGYTLPEDIPYETRHTKINSEWYHIHQDWL